MSLPFQDAGPAGGSPTPSMRQLANRLLVVRPKALEVVPDNYNAGQTKERLTCDVVFLDGDPIDRIVKQGKPDSMLEEPIKKGQVLENMFISNGALIGQLKGKTMVLGRLVQGVAKNGNNPPWVLGERTPADDELGARWWAKKGEEFLASASVPLSAPVPVTTPEPTPAPAPAAIIPAAPPAVDEDEF